MVYTCMSASLSLSLFISDYLRLRAERANRRSSDAYMVHTNLLSVFAA